MDDAIRLHNSTEIALGAPILVAMIFQSVAFSQL